jgi:hypothetical protein
MVFLVNFCEMGEFLLKMDVWAPKVRDWVPRYELWVWAMSRRSKNATEWADSWYKGLR